MKKILSVVFCLFGSLLTSIANAALIEQTHDITLDGEGTVGYTYFEVTTAGLFDIYTDATTLDGELYLFADDGVLDSSDFLAYNDDSCPLSLCAESTVGVNALVSEFFLDVGFYVAAVSDYQFTRDEAILGLNNGHGNQVGDATILVDVSVSDTYGANARIATVPEPATFVLLGLGLIGVVGFRHRNH